MRRARRRREDAKTRLGKKGDNVSCGHAGADASPFHKHGASRAYVLERVPVPLRRFAALCTPKGYTTLPPPSPTPYACRSGAIARARTAAR